MRRLSFFVLGLICAALWLAPVPYVSADLDVDKGDTELALFNTGPPANVVLDIQAAELVAANPRYQYNEADYNYSNQGIDLSTVSTVDAAMKAEVFYLSTRIDQVSTALQIIQGRPHGARCLKTRFPSSKAGQRLASTIGAGTCNVPFDRLE